MVNDVASVNIDAKLIANIQEGESDGAVQLENGCACCSLADELLTSIQTLTRGRDFDAIVIELSGVADPISVKTNWEQAKFMNHPVTKVADVKNIVTVIDACTFGTDWMTWDIAGDRDGWVAEDDACASKRNVPELLAEQVEAADVILVNKIDLAGETQVEAASEVARGLNQNAPLYTVSFGKITPNTLLGMMDTPVEETHDEEAACGHDHSHSHEEAASDCSDPTCTDPTHDHSHSHEHAASDCSDPKCTDPTHDHSHSHDHASDCSDPTCTDPTHDHSHSHDHAEVTGLKKDITSFVFKSDRPFDAARLMNVLNRWPVPIKDDLDLGQFAEANAEGILSEDGRIKTNPFVGVLRSKGFAWLAPTSWDGPRTDTWRHDTAMYWSHAGKHFGINTAGKWWGSVSEEEMKGYFTTNLSEYERIKKEDWASEEFGDRRQELVFIGVNIDEGDITEELNKCLLDDGELDAYRQQINKFLDTTIGV